MRNFFNSHWKVILAILLTIVLAMLTVETSSSAYPLAMRLQQHVQALAPDTPGSAMRHIDTALVDIGYTPRSVNDSDDLHASRGIEVSVASLAPGARAQQLFIVGARLGRDGNSGAAAVLELARAVKHLRPALGTEIRFVFFERSNRPDVPEGLTLTNQDVGANFMAFIGSRESSAPVRQALAAFRSDPAHARQGLATPAHVMGVTLYGHASQDRSPVLVITDTGFLNYPYFNTGADIDELDAEGMAHVVDGLARTLAALAGAVEI